MTMQPRQWTSMAPLLGAWLLGATACDIAVPDAPTADRPTPLPADSEAATQATTATEPASAPSIAAPASATPATSASALGSASAPTASASAPTPPSSAADAPPPPCPSDMVLVGRTCVDPYEGFLVELGSDGTKKPHPHTERPAKGVKYLAANEAGHFPQGYISRVESLAACKEAGKRLCTKGEWQGACRGKGGAHWPYGHNGSRDKCNTGKLHLLTLEFPKVQGGWKYDEHFNNPILNAKPGWLAESGKYDQCVSEKGVHDMVGNLHEWVSGMVDQELVDKMAEESFTRRDQPWRTGNGIFMGGFYSTTSEHGPGCEFITIAHEPSYHDYSTGFRCCKDAVLPKPERKKR